MELWFIVEFQRDYPPEPNGIMVIYKTADIHRDNPLLDF